MLELLLIALPAMLVITVASVLLRRERADAFDSFDGVDVPTVTVEGPDWTRDHRRQATTRCGALVEPSGRTLGRRMLETAPPTVQPLVRFRRRQLVAARSEG